MTFRGVTREEGRFGVDLIRIMERVNGMMRAADSPTPEEFAPLAGKWVGPIGGFLATLIMARWCARRTSDRRMVHGLAIGIGTALLDVVLGYSMGGSGAIEPIFVVSNVGRTCIPHGRLLEVHAGGHLIWFGKDSAAMHDQRMVFMRQSLATLLPSKRTET